MCISWCNPQMDTRSSNLRRLLDTRQWQLADLVKQCGRSVSFWSDRVGGRRFIGEKVARSIEESLGLPNGWLDQDRDQNDLIPSIPLEGDQAADATLRHLMKLPVIGWAALESCTMSEMLVTVESRELWPEIAPGDRLHVDPAAPIEPGRTILCRDQAGTWRVRTVRDLGGGRLEAAAKDASIWAPIPFEQLTHVLRVVWVHKAV